MELQEEERELNREDNDLEEGVEEDEEDELDSLRSDYNPKYQWLRQENKLHLILMNVDFDQKSLRCITRPSKPTPKVIIQGYRIEKSDQSLGYYGLFYNPHPSYRYIPFTTVLTLPDVPIDMKKAPRATYYDDQSIMQITYSILPEHISSPETQKSYKRPSPQPAMEEEEPVTRMIFSEEDSLLDDQKIVQEVLGNHSVEEMEHRLDQSIRDSLLVKKGSFVS